MGFVLTSNGTPANRITFFLLDYGGLKMTKSLSSFPKNQRLEVALHRIQEKKGGLGFFAAVDYFKAVDKKVLEEKQADQLEKFPPTSFSG